MRNALWPSLLMLAGCANAPIVSSPLEEPGEAYRGAVTPLAQLLEGKKEAVVVFIHGVGDHCPGYALSPAFGWINPSAMSTIGLTATDTGPPAVTDIYDSEFLPNHPHDAASMVSFVKREFTYAPGKGTGSVKVHAVEITWSQLTQWVKTNQLDYDLTEPLERPPSLTTTCPYTPPASYKKPPPREKLNRLLKESVLDRSLVDAVLYAGDYGKNMRRGIAAALCRAMGGTENPSGAVCNWPAADPATVDPTAYFFVTHSLGGRLLYDTLLGLEGDDVSPRAQTFTPDEQRAAQPFVSQLILHTASVYMMANQLPLLGLAYEEGHSSSEGPHPLVPLVQAEAMARGLPPPSRDVAATSAPQIRMQPSVNGFAAVRAQAARRAHVSVPKLSVVAFSDPNDLLSWSIPKWYQAPSDGVPPHADFTNVYLQNSAHWFGVVEAPAVAHTGYFVSDDVWRVIQCGASAGKVNACPEPPRP